MLPTRIRVWTRICILTVTLFLILFASRHLSVSSLSNSPIDNSRYVTWEIPGFAYTNNQIVLDVAARLFNPTERTIISPPLHTPDVRGAVGETIPLSVVFSMNDTVVPKDLGSP